jgi:hypothetical protein
LCVFEPKTCRKAILQKSSLNIKRPTGAANGKGGAGDTLLSSKQHFSDVGSADGGRVPEIRSFSGAFEFRIVFLHSTFYNMKAQTGELIEKNDISEYFWRKS